MCGARGGGLYILSCALSVFIPNLLVDLDMIFGMMDDGHKAQGR